MSEALNARNIAEIGTKEFQALNDALTYREANQLNSVGWGGKIADLKVLVEAGSLCPASSFAVVAEGMTRYKREETELRESTASLRDLADALKVGSEIFHLADEIDAPGVRAQIKSYIETHGGKVAEDIDWSKLIKERSDRLIKRAADFDKANQ